VALIEGMTVRNAQKHQAPPSKETILRRLDEINRGAVELRSHEELLSRWDQKRRAAAERIQGKTRSIQ
jgi:hypothetical protein